uniref:Uncharacterized protein n=1 Tax=Spongospora subterranea TaxID=70186 RepID=A0A0H5QTX5_9EUKA|eukprot:CRZ05021.1 hypothetical protein [Spongospora subterranea]
MYELQCRTCNDTVRIAFPEITDVAVLYIASFCFRIYGLQMPQGLVAKLALWKQSQWVVESGRRIVGIRVSGNSAAFVVYYESEDIQVEIDLLNSSAADTLFVLEQFPKLIFEVRGETTPDTISAIEITILMDQVPKQTPDQTRSRFDNMLDFIGCFFTCKYSSIAPNAVSDFSEPGNPLSRKLLMPKADFPNCTFVDENVIRHQLERLRIDPQFQAYCREIGSIWTEHSKKP